ncbi:hypothetical protein ACWEWQ_39250, partial [Streptomyces sp. NPDC003832]
AGEPAPADGRAAGVPLSAGRRDGAGRRRLLRRIRVLRSAAHVHRVPWIPAWRLGGSPKSPPRQLVSLGELVAGAGRREETAS